MNNDLSKISFQVEHRSGRHYAIALLVFSSGSAKQFEYGPYGSSTTAMTFLKRQEEEIKETYPNIDIVWGAIAHVPSDDLPKELDDEIWDDEEDEEEDEEGVADKEIEEK